MARGKGRRGHWALARHHSKDDCHFPLQRCSNLGCMKWFDLGYWGMEAIIEAIGVLELRHWLSSFIDFCSIEGTNLHTTKLVSTARDIKPTIE